jgi:hypothetical protein
MIFGSMRRSTVCSPCHLDIRGTGGDVSRRPASRVRSVGQRADHIGRRARQGLTLDASITTVTPEGEHEAEQGPRARCSPSSASSSVFTEGCGCRAILRESFNCRFMPEPVPATAARLDDLSVDEKIDYLQSLRDRIAATPETIPGADWHQEILDERLSDLKADPAAGDSLAGCAATPPQKIRQQPLPRGADRTPLRQRAFPSVN